MELTKHETCLEYFERRLSEGWECISLDGYKAVLLSPHGIRRGIDLRNDVETLRPDGAGTYAQWLGTGTCLYTAVDEEIADGDTTYIQITNNQGALEKAAFNLPNSAIGAGVINSVTVKMTAKKLGDTSPHKILTRTVSTDYVSAGYLDLAYTERSIEYVTNPNTGLAWTWAQVNALEAGIQGYGSSAAWARCTQIYVEVDYSPEAGLEKKSGNIAAGLMAAGVI